MTTEQTNLWLPLIITFGIGPNLVFSKLIVPCEHPWEWRWYYLFTFRGIFKELAIHGLGYLEKLFSVPYVSPQPKSLSYWVIMEFDMVSGFCFWEIMNSIHSPNLVLYILLVFWDWLIWFLSSQSLHVRLVPVKFHLKPIAIGRGWLRFY